MATRKETTKENSIKFMLAEFNLLLSLHENAMNTREERLKNYFNIIFGIGAFLAFIYQVYGISEQFYYLLVTISVVSYLYGIIIYIRLTDVSLKDQIYSRALNRVRRYFVDLDKEINDYILMPINDDSPGLGARGFIHNRGISGGLLIINIVTNIFLSTIFILTLFLSIIKLQIIPSIGIGLAFIVLNWLFHFIVYRSIVQRVAKVSDVKFPSTTS